MPTIRDVANECGLSPATVSRILNNDVNLQVTDDTRRKVIDAADRLGYVKKGKAKTKALFRLGILQWFSAQQELEDEYYLKIRMGIEDFCVRNSISIERAYRTDTDYRDTLKDCDGLVCVGKFSKSDEEELSGFKSNIIFVDMETSHPEVTTITADLYTAAKEALEYLKDLGHEKICYLGGVEYASGKEMLTDPRKKAYVRFMKNNKFSHRKLLREDEFNSVSGYKMMKDILSGAEIPTAVLAASDAIALGAVKAAREEGYGIPGDISIISINDNEISAFTEPPLTTMHVPAYEMGQHAANLIYVAGNLDIKTPLKVMIPCTMIIRGSCAGNSRRNI